MLLDALVLFWIVLAFASAYTGSQKNRSAVAWFLAGLLFGPIALVMLAAIPNRIYRPKKCGMCAELVRGDARVCRYCGNHFDDPDRRK